MMKMQFLPDLAIGDDSVEIGMPVPRCQASISAHIICVYPKIECIWERRLPRIN